jgi:hypothetical protein
MVQNTKNLVQLLTAREMKKVVGGTGPRRKNVCVICGPGNVHCASVLATAQCEVFDYVAAPTGEPADHAVPGWMGCKNDSGEGWAFEHHC